LTKSSYGGALGGPPSWHAFVDFLSAFGGNRQFHPTTPPATRSFHQTIPLQWTEISHKRRAIHPQPIAQFRHAPILLRNQRPQESPLCGADSMTPHFRIKKLRNFPRYPTQVEAHTVFHRRHIQFFRHGVYMHYFGADVNSLLFLIFQLLVARAKTPENCARLDCDVQSISFAQ
jgi:hypothetical protein